MSSPLSPANIANNGDDREYLELKLKYVQSVSTVFRQRVSILLHDLLEGRINPEDRSAIKELMHDMDAMGEASPPRELGDGSEYWRERFLQSLEDTRPSSLQEAQTLCGLLQERSELQLKEKALRQRNESLEFELQKMKDNYLRVLDAKTMSAEDALIEKYKAKEAELVRMNPNAGTSFAVAEAEQLRAEITKSEQRMKVLRLRSDQQRQELEAARSQLVAIREDHTRQLEGLIAGANDLRAKLAVRDAEARRAEADRATAERTVVLKDHTIVRLEARLVALGKEVEAALKEGTANVTTTETAILRRQIDSFELKIRELEGALRERNQTIVTLEDEVRTLRDTIAAKQLVIESKTKLADTLNRRLENCVKDEQQKEAHTAMLAHLEERMMAALKDVASRQNASDLTTNVSTLNTQVSTIESAKKTLELTQGELERVKGELAAYKAELTRCAKLNRTPSLETVEAEVVRARLIAMDGDALSPSSAGTAEVVLRRSGPWSEVRERSTGKLYYTTTDGSLTPFKPTKLKPLPPPAPPTPEAPVVTVTEAPPSRDKTPRSTVENDPLAGSGVERRTPDRRTPLRLPSQDDLSATTPDPTTTAGGAASDASPTETETELASPY